MLNTSIIYTHPPQLKGPISGRLFPGITHQAPSVMFPCFPFIFFQSFPPVVIKPVSEIICDVAPSLGGETPGGKD